MKMMPNYIYPNTPLNRHQTYLIGEASALPEQEKGRPGAWSGRILVADQ